MTRQVWVVYRGATTISIHNSWNNAYDWATDHCVGAAYFIKEYTLEE